MELDENGLPVVSVHLAGDAKGTGRDFRFLLDTGASGTVIDKSVLAACPTKTRKGKAEVTGAGGEAIRTYTVELERLVFGACDGPVRVAVMDLKRALGPLQDRPVDGVLGMDVLRRNLFTLDFRGKQIQWAGPRPEGGATARIPIALGPEGQPYVSLEVGSEIVRVMCDTGASGMALTLPRKYLPKGQGGGLPGGYTTVSGRYQDRLEVAFGGQVRLGSAPLDNPLVEVRSDDPMDPKACLLGLDVLGAEKATFDFLGGFLYLPLDDKGRIPVKRPERSIVRFVWNGEEGSRRLMIGGMKPGGAYELAGAQIGDEVVGLGPLTGPTLTRRDAGAFLAKGESHRILVRRRGAIFTIQVKVVPVS